MHTTATAPTYAPMTGRPPTFRTARHAHANDRTHERLDPPIDRGGHRQQQHAERDNEREPHPRPSRVDRERLETKPPRRLACRVDEAVRPGRELKVVPSEHFCGDRTDPGNELDRQRRELEQ